MPAERRQLTILNCDIVNSTHYADTMDPEEFEAVMTCFFDICRAVVEDHRGTFAHHTGDGFVAYFGYPQTQGRNAQEAIECARAVFVALSTYKIGSLENLEVRIGISTGQVILSTHAKQDSSSAAMAVGGAFHLAARIQSLASPNTIYVDSKTNQLAQPSFEFIDRGMHEMKGFAEPSHVWKVRKPRELEYRFEERRSRLTPFVGRTRELGILESCWRRAQAGEGQAVIVSGEPGIGKSRLVFEFLQRIDRAA